MCTSSTLSRPVSSSSFVLLRLQTLGLESCLVVDTRSRPSSPSISPPFFVSVPSTSNIRSILCRHQSITQPRPLVLPPFANRRFRTRTASMYYNPDNDNDPYAPHTGPTAMPSPRSKFAPYFSGRADDFEDFLQEFEDLARACELTEPQQVDALVRYLDRSSREFCSTRNGYHMRDWFSFRQDLIHSFGTTVPRHQIKRKKPYRLVEDSSRSRMTCKADVLQYYRDFMCYSFFFFFLDPFLCALGHITPHSTSLLIHISESTCASFVPFSDIIVPPRSPR